MTVLDREIPQPVALEGILRKITEGLAKELGSPTQVAPDWSEFEWIVARAVAAMHGVSPLLSRALRWQGPAGWTGFLEEQRAHTAKRHVRIDDLLLRLDQRAREAGVAAVALKGVALHALGVYQAGDRPMADVDLLVRPADAHCTAKMLESLGYAEFYKTWKECVFTRVDDQNAASLGEHSNNGIKIELHERISEKLPLRITDVSEHVFPPQLQPGLNAYPSKASLMIHLLLHAAGAMASQSLRLLHLHDLARLSSQMTQDDWEAVLQAGERGRRPWWAFPPLNLTSRYFPSKIPGGKGLPAVELCTMSPIPTSGLMPFRVWSGRGHCVKCWDTWQVVCGLARTTLPFVRTSRRRKPGYPRAGGFIFRKTSEFYAGSLRVRRVRRPCTLYAGRSRNHDDAGGPGVGGVARRLVG
jgi:hypothetical protein